MSDVGHGGRVVPCLDPQVTAAVTGSVVTPWSRNPTAEQVVRSCRSVLVVARQDVRVHLQRDGDVGVPRRATRPSPARPTPAPPWRSCGGGRGAGSVVARPGRRVAEQVRERLGVRCRPVGDRHDEPVAVLPAGTHQQPVRGLRALPRLERGDGRRADRDRPVPARRLRCRRRDRRPVPDARRPDRRPSRPSGRRRTSAARAPRHVACRSSPSAPTRRPTGANWSRRERAQLVGSPRGHLRCSAPRRVRSVARVALESSPSDRHGTPRTSTPWTFLTVFGASPAPRPRRVSARPSASNVAYNALSIDPSTVDERCTADHRLDVEADDPVIRVRRRRTQPGAPRRQPFVEQERLERHPRRSHERPTRPARRRLSFSAALASFFVAKPRRLSCWRLPLAAQRSTTKYHVPRVVVLLHAHALRLPRSCNQSERLTLADHLLVHDLFDTARLGRRENPSETILGHSSSGGSPHRHHRRQGVALRRVVKGRPRYLPVVTDRRAGLRHHRL